MRNEKGLLPLSLKSGDKIVLVNIQKANQNTMSFVCGLDELEVELSRRGFVTKVLINPGHNDIKALIDDYDCILINCKLSCQDYPGGSLRTGWDHIRAFWRGYIFKHPKVIFTSFGDPYKLYEFPYLHTYINAFSYSESTQRGFVKVLLGEVEETAKSPVALDSFFDRDV